MLERLGSVVAELGTLADDVTLVGGCLTPLLVSDPAAPTPRATVDVDLIVEVATNSAYHQLGREMCARGFRQGVGEDDPICRFRKADLIVDLLPTDPRVLGFGNRWYALAAETAVKITLPSGRTLRHATAPCFLATKIEAFRGRGRSDYLASRDFEDIVSIVDGRAEMEAEFAAAPAELQHWVKAELRTMIVERGFLDSIFGMVPGQSDVAGRVELLRARFMALASA